MNISKIVLGLLLSFLIIVLSLVLCLKDKDKSTYQEAVNFLMIQEGLSSPEETVNYFPELRDIKSKIDRIDYLSRTIHRFTEGPAPEVSINEQRLAKEYYFEIKHLRKSVTAGLSRMLATYP